MNHNGLNQRCCGSVSMVEEEASLITILYNANLPRSNSFGSNNFKARGDISRAAPIRWQRTGIMGGMINCFWMACSFVMATRVRDKADS